jgi:phosphoglycerate dehydrogenase-like enzyme
MSKPRILVLAWLPEGKFEELQQRRPDFEWLDGRTDAGRDAHLARATITYGLPPVARVGDMPELRWIQLISAGVPADLCPAARQRNITVTNLAGLYGNSIAERAFAMMLFLAHNLHTAFRNQVECRWDRDVAAKMHDLAGRTLAIIGLGNIGQAIARLGRAFGMRVVGCRRTDALCPAVDRVYPLKDLRAMLAEADVLAVAGPLTARTEGMLGPAEFAALKPGVLYINVSRGPIAQEAALLDALRSGGVAGAGLDVFTTEPLPPDHPLWTMPQVIVSPHVAGDIVNLSPRPAERFARNLAAWAGKRPLEGLVDLEQGY